MAHDHGEGGGPGGWTVIDGSITEMVMGGTQLEAGAVATIGVGVLADDPVLSHLLVDHLVSEGPRAVSAITDIDRDLRAEHEVVVAFPPREVGSFVAKGWESIIGSVPFDRALVVIAVPPVPLRKVIEDRPATSGLVVLDPANVESFRHIRTAIGAAANGERAIDGSFRDPGGLLRDDGRLTSTERSVLRLLGEGLSNEAISEELFVSERTIEGHTRSIFSKLSLADNRKLNRRVLAAIAARTAIGGGR